LVDGQWAPTFPKAKHVFAESERDFYASPAAASRRMVFEDSVLPIIQTGQAVAIGERGGTYLDGVTFLPTPGHAPGHMAIVVRSAGEEAVFSGDIAHTPYQVEHPEWNSVFCADPEQARSSRRWLLDYAARPNVTLFTAHFPKTSAGKIQRRGDAFAWTYV
jgi:glyoxylase-like metal-dependent hydrolase (beta-lactamase superfamily II)